MRAFKENRDPNQGHSIVKEEEQIGSDEQDVHSDQAPPCESGLQSPVEVDRGDEENDARYRCENTGVVIAIPIRDRTLKDEVGERKKVMVPVVMVRQEVETAVDEQTPCQDGYTLGVQEVIPDP